jgi:hypothetical protein
LAGFLLAGYLLAGFLLAGQGRPDLGVHDLAIARDDHTRGHFVGRIETQNAVANKVGEQCRNVAGVCG